MSWKSLVCVVFLCGLVAAPVTAQEWYLDLVRDGNGRPALDGNGDYQWRAMVDPDDASVGSGNGAVAIELGLAAFEAAILGSAAKNDASVPSPNGSEPGGLNPGEPIFGWEALTDVDDGPGENMKAVGIQTETAAPATTDALGEIFAALGTINFGTEGGDDTAQEIFTFTTDGPSTNGTLTSRVDWLGVYQDAVTLGGSNGIVAQDGGAILANGSVSVVVLGGDANLDGFVDGFDQTAFNLGFQAGTGIWHNGDFTGDGNVDGFDQTVFNLGFQQNASPDGPPGDAVGPGTGSMGAGANISGVPEPSSLILIMLGATLAALRIRR